MIALTDRTQADSRSLLWVVFLVAMLSVLALLLTGCSSGTQTVPSWTDPEAIALIASNIEFDAKRIFGDRLGLMFWDAESGLLQIPVRDLQDHEAEEFLESHSYSAVEIRLRSSVLGYEDFSLLNDELKATVRMTEEELGLAVPRSIGLSREMAVVRISYPEDDIASSEVADAIAVVRGRVYATATQFLTNRGIDGPVELVVFFDDSGPPMAAPDG